MSKEQGVQIPRYDAEKPVGFDIVSTFSPKHGATVGESLGSEALAGHVQGVHGDAVRVLHIDLQLDPDIQELTKIIIDNPPHILGISVKIGALDQAEKIIHCLNEVNFNPGTKPLVVMGGVLPTFATAKLHEMYPNSVMAVNEGENSVAALVEVIRGDKTLDQVPGIWYTDKDGCLRINSPKRLDLSNRFLPARQTTQRIHRELNGMIWAEASRGCNYSCTFCSIKELHGGGFVGEMTPESVIQDMKNLKSLGINSVSFTDDDFEGDPERAATIAKLLKAENLGMSFSISTRADHIWNEGVAHSRNGRQNTEELDKYNARLLEIMTDLRDAGLVRVFLGMESGSPTQLKRYGKLITVDGNYKAIEILEELKIDAVAGWIPIDQDMVIPELLENIEFLKRTGMARKVTNPLSVLRVQAGSPYLKLAEREKLVDGPTEDLVFYKAHFKDPSIQKVADLADQWVHEMYSFIFGLKGEVATATLGPGGNGSAITRNVEQILFAFRDLEMTFIETITKALFEDPDTNTDKIVTEFKEQRSKLVLKSGELANTGQFGNSPRLLEVIKNFTGDPTYE